MKKLVYCPGGTCPEPVATSDGLGADCPGHYVEEESEDPMTDPLKLVYRLTNAQRMALCGFLVEYTTAMLEPDSKLAQVFVNCTEVPSVETTPTDLLNIFMGSDEIEIERERRLDDEGRDKRKPS